jgi:hypothetical protein
MKRFVLASLIALAASQAAGCIITSGDDDGGGGDAFISATWSIRSEATNSEVGCPSGFDTAALYNQPVDANGTSIGSPIIDLFDCVAKSGTSAPLPPQLYKSWIVIADHTNANQYATSLSAFVDVTVSDKTINTQILTDGGYFMLSWNLQGAATNAPLTCAQAGASGGVEAVGTLVSNPNVSNSDIFDCEDRSGVTAGYTAGLYTVSVAALNSADLSVGTAAPLTNRAIEAPNRVTDLGTITIPIDGL